MSELEFIEVVSKEDHKRLKEKALSYKDSWKKSGGRSAWFMIKRKIDRLLNMLEKPEDPKIPGLDPLFPFKSEEFDNRQLIEFYAKSLSAEDIFLQIKRDPSGKDGTVLAEIRDLRSYLILVESEMMRLGIVASQPFEKDDESLHSTQVEEHIKAVEELKRTLPKASRFKPQDNITKRW